MNALRHAPAALVTLFLFAAPISVWIASTGNPLFYFRYEVPPGQFLYVLSRLAALVALSLFWFQAMAALANGVPRLQGFFRISPPSHRRIGLALFALVMTHGLLFFLAATLRTGHVAYDVFVPSFDSGFYKFYVSFGVIALALFPLGIAAGYLRRRRPDFRWLHRVWAVVFVLVLLHGLVIGTETRIGLMFYVYMLMAVSLGAGVILRLMEWRRQTGKVAASGLETSVESGGGRG